MKLLHLDSSILGAGSVSRTLSAEIVAAQAAIHPGIGIVYRDLATDPIGHLNGPRLAALQGATPSETSIEADVEKGKPAVEEFLAADIVVIGAPMYNFDIPSQLKAWIDRIAVAGKTFRYTEQGPQGLAGGKKLIIVSSRGGVFGPGSPAAALPTITRDLPARVVRFPGTHRHHLHPCRGCRHGPRCPPAGDCGGQGRSDQAPRLDAVPAEISPCRFNFRRSSPPKPAVTATSSSKYRSASHTYSWACR